MIIIALPLRWPKTEPHALTCSLAFAYARVPQSLVLQDLFLETVILALATSDLFWVLGHVHLNTWGFFMFYSNLQLKERIASHASGQNLTLATILFI